jgi:hypothetical protein
MHGSKMDWARGVALQFLPQLQNMVVHGAGAGIILVSPDLVEQFIARNGPSRILNEVFQGFKFQGSEHNRLSLAALSSAS